MIGFTTLLGLSYDLQQAGEVTGGGWSLVVSNVSGTGGGLAVTDTDAAGHSRRFYRVRLSP